MLNITVFATLPTFLIAGAVSFWNVYVGDTLPVTTTTNPTHADEIKCDKKISTSETTPWSSLHVLAGRPDLQAHIISHDKLKVFASGPASSLVRDADRACSSPVSDSCPPLRLAKWNVDFDPVSYDIADL